MEAGKSQFSYFSFLEVKHKKSTITYECFKKFQLTAMFRGGFVSNGTSMPGVLGSNGSTWIEQRRYSLHTLKDLGFGKSSMEALIAEEVNELCKHLESFGGKPIDVRNEFNIAILNALWTLSTSERLGYEDPKLRK